MIKVFQICLYTKILFLIASAKRFPRNGIRKGQLPHKKIHGRHARRKGALWQRKTQTNHPNPTLLEYFHATTKLNSK